jgi:hypothetical protein
MPKVERFISPRGPDRKDERCDVRFLESVVTYDEAVRRRTELQAHFDAEGPGHAVVVYRSSHDGDSYFLSRQIDDDLKGEQCHPRIPASSHKLGYDLFVAPKTLLSTREPRREPELWKAIAAISDFGQGPPSDGEPN